MKRLIPVSALLVMLPVLPADTAMNAPTDNVQVEETGQAETAEPSSNSTLTITMAAVDD